MEPTGDGPRRTPMRTLALTVAALLLPLSLAACGSDDDGGDVASDPAPTTATASPSPTAAPTVGTYPAFEPTDYTFELTVSCFCMGAGTPIHVTVVEAEVVDAIYAEGGYFNLTVHPRVGYGSGSPARVAIVEKLIEYIKGHDSVRFVGMLELAQWCLKNALAALGARPHPNLMMVDAY